MLVVTSTVMKIVVCGILPKITFSFQYRLHIANPSASASSPVDDQNSKNVFCMRLKWCLVGSTRYYTQRPQMNWTHRRRLSHLHLAEWQNFVFKPFILFSTQQFDALNIECYDAFNANHQISPPISHRILLHRFYKQNDGVFALQQQKRALLKLFSRMIKTTCFP